MMNVSEDIVATLVGLLGGEMGARWVRERTNIPVQSTMWIKIMAGGLVAYGGMSMGQSFISNAGIGMLAGGIHEHVIRQRVAGVRRTR